MQSCFALVVLLLISLALLTPNAHGDSDTNINFYFADLLRGSSGNLTSPSTRPSCVESPLIVVGGGWSGLTTAIEAKKRGCRVLLLEGQNYLGGRSHTVRTGGSIVEFGSNWVHGTPETGHPFPDFMESLGFDTSDPDVLFRVDAVNATSSAALIGFLDSLGYPGQWFANDTRLGNDSIDLSFKISEEWFERIAEAVVERQTKGSPLYTPGDVSLLLGELTSPSVQAWKRNLTATEIGYANWHRNNDYSEDFAASVEQMSLFNHYPPQRLYEGGNNVIPFGYSVIVNKYAEALTSTELYLNTKVVKIEHSPTGVKVYTANGTVHSGSTVVVTVPLGVLKNDVIEFDPPVDAPIAQAISALDMGTLDKVWLKFEKPFWDVNTYTWFVLPDADDPSQKPSFINTFFNALFERRPGDNQNVLGYFVGAGTEYKLYLSDQEIIDQSMPVLYNIFGSNISQPIGVIRTNWTNNPFTYGTYSYPRTYSELYHFSNFIVNGSQSSLHFGGEHTSRTGFGFQYGAQATGYREARAILALPENVAAGVTQISEEEYQTLAGHPDEVEYLPNVKRGEETSYPPYTPYCEAYNVYLQRKNAGLVQ